MAGNSFGQMFRISTFGESHGPALGCVIDGCPPGLAITEEDIQLVEVKKSIGTGTFRKKSDLIGRKLKNNVSVGFALRSRHLEPNWVIKSGDKIDIVQNGNTFNVSVTGIALQNGQEGEKIKVRNISSEKVLVARVINEKKVSINAKSLNN